MPLSPVDIAYETYGTLDEDARQRDPDLPCADRRPACRERSSGDRQAGLVDADGGTGQADRSGAAFHRLRQRAGQLHGIVRPRQHQSRHRPALGHGISGDHDPRHGARAGDATRSSRHRHARGGGRRVDGRDAGAQLAGDVPRPRSRGGGDRFDRAAHRAEHRLSRGRPPGGYGRSEMARRRLLWRPRRTGEPAGGRTRRRPDGRAHHLSVGSGA